MQQRFFSVSPCLNSWGVSVMTACNLPHVILNECPNKGYPIYGKCHNLEQNGCITTGVISVLLMPQWSLTLLTCPTTREDWAERSCLFDFISVSKKLSQVSFKPPPPMIYFYISSWIILLFLSIKEKESCVYCSLFHYRCWNSLCIAEKNFSFA